MLLSTVKEDKIKADVLLTKKSADSFWSKMFGLFVEGKVEQDFLISAMEVSNRVDKEIIEKYGTIYI